MRHTCYSWLQANRPKEVVGGFDEALYGQDEEHGALGELPENDPAAWLERTSEAQSLNAAIAELPLEFREVLILREILPGGSKATHWPERLALRRRSARFRARSRPLPNDLSRLTQAAPRFAFG